MFTCIFNARVILQDRVLENHSILIADDTIINVFPDGDVPLSPDTMLFNAEGLHAGPGFIDIHCHGGNGYWVHDDPEAVSSFHLKHGTTAMLATTVPMSSHEETLASVQAIEKVVQSGAAPNIIGIHMEGPYLSPKHGASRELSRLPKKEEYLAYEKAGSGLIKTWTIAPELPGIFEMVSCLQQVSNGKTLFSVGHSEACDEQIYKLIPSGLRIATHCTNATGCSVSPSRYLGTREFGVDEAVWLDDAVFAEVIPDYHGRHVRHRMLQLIMKVKGIDRTIIVTDATNTSGRLPQKSLVAGEINQDVNYNSKGELSGSALTMDVACSNVLRQTNISLPEVFCMASYNPAAALYILDKFGQIAPGRVADILLFDYRSDEQIKIVKIMFRGEFQSSK